MKLTTLTEILRHLNERVVKDKRPWAAATWEGARREQIRRALKLSVRERLEALESLSETSEQLLQGKRRRSEDRVVRRSDGKPG